MTYQATTEFLKVSDRFRQQGLRVLCIVDHIADVLVEVRLIKPLTRWAQNFGGKVTLRTFHSLKDGDLVSADVVIFQRLATEDALFFARQIKSNGTAVIFEIDDLLTNLPWFLEHHNSYLKNINKNFASIASTVDAFSASTPILAQQMREFNQNVFVVPNYAEPVAHHARHTTSVPAEARLLVSSSDDVLVDFLIAPLLQIQHETGVQVIAIGPPGKRLSDAGIKVDHRPLMSHAAYKSLIASMDNCIGLAPLDSSVFSSCKTAIKFFDYAVSGVPIICSDVPPFNQVIENTVDGFLVDNTTDQWVDAMRTLITSHERRQRVVMAAQETVRVRHSLDIAAAAWQNVFTSLAIGEAQKAKNASMTFTLPRRFGMLRRDFVRLKALCRHLLRPASYGRALAAILRHGPLTFVSQLRQR